MKISYNWLKDYVDVNNSARQVAEWLTMAGLEVTSLEEKDRDSVMDIEVTTNRPDWLSFIGVAREVSAITGKKLKLPTASMRGPAISSKGRKPSVEIKDKQLCPRYTARIIEGVKIAPSPKWLSDKLESIGVRPVNNVVDITNFCLFELGQPLHAFDLDKLNDGAIVVRKARKGEKMTAIDGTEIELDGAMLIIADSKVPVAIAGIMGGLATEVSDNTRTILLESAYFDPVSVRGTSRKTGLSSDSSYRFERRVDLEGILRASNRAAAMITKICGGQIGELKDVGTKIARAHPVKISVSKANQILSSDLSAVSVKKILTNLGLKVGPVSDILKVDPPSFRADLKREEDLIEEIARVHGYNAIPTTIPKIVGHPVRKCRERQIEETAKNILVSLGLDEIITYSLIAKKSVEKIYSKNDTVALKNPLSAQQEIMRPTLIPGALEAARFNINRKSEDIQIFELSKTYQSSLRADPQSSLRADNLRSKRAPSEAISFLETRKLCILCCGAAGDWRSKARADFLHLKGLIEALFERLGVCDYGFAPEKQDNVLYPETSASILVRGKEIGTAGAMRDEILADFDIKKEIFICELNFDEIISAANLTKYFKTPSKFLPVRRDISFILDEAVTIQSITDAIKGTNAELIKDVTIFDEYRGRQIPDGKKSLSFSVEYLSFDRQFTAQEIEQAHGRVKEALEKKFNASLR
ncbi:MAG: phenylalanine--tRNA ligase subunit beta [Candidatus Omnitrophota bacterium]